MSGNFGKQRTGIFGAILSFLWQSRNSSQIWILNRESSGGPGRGRGGVRGSFSPQCETRPKSQGWFVHLVNIMIGIGAFFHLGILQSSVKVKVVAIINGTSIMNSGKNLQYDFPKMRGGSQAVWNFSENSSVLMLQMQCFHYSFATPPSVVLY